MRRLSAVFLMLCPALLLSQGSTGSFRLRFVPADSTFATAVRGYDSLWRAEGGGMLRALENAAGRRFAALGDTAITAIIFEGVSNSGTLGAPMRLRASYPVEVRKAVLMHELGHRLQDGVVPAGGDEHGTLFLWLHRAWVEAYGEDFAREQVAVERGRGGVYPAAWDGALALTAEARQARWAALRDAVRPGKRPGD